MKTFTDRNGACYRLEIDDEDTSAHFKVFVDDPKIQRTPIGYANCLYDEKDVLLLADIEIKEDVILVYRNIGLFGKFRQPKRERRNFRGLGIGSEILRAIVEFAKINGVRKIVGKIKDVDYPKNPKLPRWYEDRGFKVEMNPNGSAIKGWISMEL